MNRWGKYRWGKYRSMNSYKKAQCAITAYTWPQITWNNWINSGGHSQRYSNGLGGISFGYSRPIQFDHGPKSEFKLWRHAQYSLSFINFIIIRYFIKSTHSSSHCVLGVPRQRIVSLICASSWLLISIQVTWVYNCIYLVSIALPHCYTFLWDAHVSPTIPLKVSPHSPAIHTAYVCCVLLLAFITCASAWIRVLYAMNTLFYWFIVAFDVCN